MGSSEPPVGLPLDRNMCKQSNLRSGTACFLSSANNLLFISDDQK